jgi:hypothetical protein
LQAKFLSSSGGGDLKDLYKRMMQKIICDDVVAKFSLLGRGTTGKTGITIYPTIISVLKGL